MVQISNLKKKNLFSMLCVSISLCVLTYLTATNTYHSFLRLCFLKACKQSQIKPSVFSYSSMLTLPSTVESQAWDMEGSYLLYLIIPLSGISEFPPSLQLGICFYLLVLTLTLFGLFVCFCFIVDTVSHPNPFLSNFCNLGWFLYEFQRFISTQML